MTAPSQESEDKPRQRAGKQRHHSADKGRTVKAVVFQVVIHSCESWIVKKAESRRIDVFTLWCWRRLLEGPLDSKETRQVNLKGNQPRILVGRTDAEAEAPVLWSSDVSGQQIGKPPAAGKD